MAVRMFRLVVWRLQFVKDHLTKGVDYIGKAKHYQASNGTSQESHGFDGGS
jgi:hypothetical protein